MQVFIWRNCLIYFYDTIYLAELFNFFQDTIYLAELTNLFPRYYLLGGIVKFISKILFIWQNCSVYFEDILFIWRSCSIYFQDTTYQTELFNLQYYKIHALVGMVQFMSKILYVCITVEGYFLDQFTIYALGKTKFSSKIKEAIEEN